MHTSVGRRVRAQQYGVLDWRAIVRGIRSQDGCQMHMTAARGIRREQSQRVESSYVRRLRKPARGKPPCR